MLPAGKVSSKSWLRKIGLGIGWLLAASIFYLSVLTPYIPTIEINHIDKVYHLIAYGGLMWWWAQLYQGAKRQIILVLVIAFGILIEFIQPYTGRQFDLLDMVANASGALIAWWIANLGGDVFAKPLGSKNT